MKNKELLETIKLVKSDIIRETFIEAYDKMNYKEKQKIAKILEDFKNKIENDLNFKAKAIAAYIRMHMEDFHCNHLSDKQMKELNPIIRNAIYTFLIDESEGDLIHISSVCKLNLPSYWEDCEYLK